MIKNSELLKDCQKQVILLADYLESIAKMEYKTELIISSGFRSEQVNNALKNASKTSLHLKGLALDFSFKNMHIFKLVTLIYKLVAEQSGVFKGVTQMEVCRGIDGTQHIHLGFGTEGFIKYFTGAYV